jgi:hypothetical protein
MKHLLILARAVTARRVRSLVVVALVSVASAGMATASGAIVLGNGGDPHEGIGQADFKTELVRGTVYTANKFPVALKIHAPAPQWGGVQLESGNYRFIQLGHSHASGTPTLTGVGYITLESAKVATPSAAKTLANLRATPHMRIGPTKAIKVAGLTGKMFDATVTGSDLSGTCPGGRACPKVVSFAPFRKNQHCGFCGDSKIDPRETLDVKAALKGQLFQVIVVSAHRKVIVIYIESIYAIQKKHPPSKIFPTFLPYAQKMLAHISFS